MKGLFSPDNPVMKFIVKIGYIWYLNILWLVTSLPLITIGASTTALIYSSMKLLKDDGYPTQNFFKSFKKNFRQSTAIWLIYLAVGALLALDLVAWNKQGQNVNFAQGLVFAILILYMLSFTYVFAIQSKFVNPVISTIRFSFILPFKYFKETILMVVVEAVVIYLNVTTIFAVNFVTLNFGVGLIAYLFAVYYRKVFENYIPRQEETALDDQEIL